MDLNLIVEDLVNWIKNKVEEAGCRGVVFGLSGGIDSAVIAGLAKLAYPNNSLGLIMPCHSLDRDELDARLVADSLNLKVEKVDLTSTYDLLLNNINLEDNNLLAKSNIKPRLRMTTLYYYAQYYKYLVLGPTNKSEFITGYFTKHGDSSVDLLPIADFVKEEVYSLASYLKIPDEIIKKKPSAGLWEDQSDEDELGLTYEELDYYISNNVATKATKEKIDNMYRKSQHKREYPPIYRVKI